jgi:diketogulonate reductase-like aldo/keto reductase
MPTAAAPLITLNNGVTMPALGLGVFQSSPEETISAVSTAIADGYRLIDTAAAYGNEREVGEGFRRSGIERGEVFVTTKLWISDYGYEPALRGIDGCLRRLGLDYVDLFLLHHPVPRDFEGTITAYRAAEQMLTEGRARAVGVANFNEHQLDELIGQTTVAPAVNQVELHPFFIQQTLRDFHTAHDIVTQAWSPLGGVNVYRPADTNTVRNPLEHPTIAELASRHQKTPAQIILRWHIEHGTSAIPKSVRPHRIAENIDVFDFTLSPDEVATIDALDTGTRGGPDPSLIDPEHYPLKVDNESN